MRGTDRRLAGFLVFAVTLGMVAVLPRTAAATGGGHHPPDPPSSCGVYPIGLKSSVVANASVGKLIDDIVNGARSGHEGWLAWTGDMSERALKTSLTYPG